MATKSACSVDGPRHRPALFGRAVRRHPCHARPATSQLFKIICESAVSSGVRRIEALTGEAARQWLNARDEKLREAAATLKASPDEVPARVAALVEERRKLERELADAKKALAMGGGGKRRSRGPRAGRRLRLPRPGGRRPRSQGPARRSRRDEAAPRLAASPRWSRSTKAAPALPSASPTTSPARSARSSWSRPRSRRWAGRAAAAVPTWPRAAGRTARRRTRRSQAVRDALEKVAA